jgi:hypothetical protein
MFIDAECAWFGDPAFDLAFCLNHLLLKCLWNRRAAPGFLASFDALLSAYRSGITWEPDSDLQRRAGLLLAALLLARVDGKSPAEYITEEHQRTLVRNVALPLIAEPAASPSLVRAAWSRALEGAPDA